MAAADMHLALVQAEALVFATLAQIDPPAPPSQAAAAGIQAAVAAAQVAVARACRTVGQGAVQLHGGMGMGMGMGMTDELRVGQAFKRLTLIEHQRGGVDAQLRRQVLLMPAA